MDIRLVRRSSKVWLWVGTLAVGALLLWSSAYLFGDATRGAQQKAVGAAANFGADRAAVLPAEVEAFESILPIEDRELGRLVRLQGTALSRVSASSLWMQARGGRRILVRFEPTPETAPRYAPGSAVRVDGYVQKISAAEFGAWIDSLGVSLPRPRPGVKFGDLPDSGFARVDSLFIRNYYISVRPEGIGGLESGVVVPQEEEPAR